MLVFVSPVVFAKSSEFEFEFKATIAEISRPAKDDSTVIVSLFSESTDFDIVVIVDANAKIESSGNEIDLSELEHAVANMIYGIGVEFGEGVVDFGTLTTNDRGCVKVEFEDSPNQIKYKSTIYYLIKKMFVIFNKYKLH